MPEEAVRIEEGDGWAALSFSARHPLLKIITLVAGVPVLLALVALLLQKMMIGDLLGMLGAGALLGLALYAIAAIGFRRRVYTLRFDRAGLRVHDRVFDYDKIEDFGISNMAIPAYDAISSPLPRNTGFGRHLYLRYKGQHVPITIGLPAKQARSVLAAFEGLITRYRHPHAGSE